MYNRLIMNSEVWKMDEKVLKIVGLVLEANRKGHDLIVRLDEYSVEVRDSKCISLLNGEMRNGAYFKEGMLMTKDFDRDADKIIEKIERMVKGA